MKFSRLVWAALLLMCLASLQAISQTFAQTGKEVIVGKWVLDTERTAKQGNKETAELLKYIGSMTLDFGENGILIAKADAGGEQELSKGTWKIIQDDAKAMLLEFREEDNSKPERIEVRFLEGGDYMLLRAGPGEKDEQAKLIFRREKRSSIRE